MTARVLATGGAGYIGSHVVLELLNAGYEVVVFDNFHNSSPVAIERVARLTNRVPELVEGDVRDDAALNALFDSHKIDVVVHLAGLKAVGESVAKPELYYDVNVAGGLRLYSAMLRHGVGRMVFSSSATVYGVSDDKPIDETTPTAPINPYGTTKLMSEHMLDDIARANPDFSAISLRYFNPVGAHPSGEIGEDPADIPNNLFPFIAQVAAGRREKLMVFGNDYDTPDGTGVRDYIHVVDLARGHVRAVEHILSDAAPLGRNLKVNLGAGRGYSVMEALAAFSQAAGQDLPYEVAERRAGDLAMYFARADKAREVLGWEAEKTLEEMCQDHWNWQRRNPDGYGRREE
jgi:UDP-glucose 4-epimerase